MQVQQQQNPLMLPQNIPRRGIVQPAVAPQAGAAVPQLYLPENAPALPAAPAQYDAGYSQGDTMIAQMFHRQNPNTLAPHNMINNPLVRRPHLALEPFNPMQQPNANTFALAQQAKDFYNPAFAHGGAVLGPYRNADRAPLSIAQKEALRQQRKQEREQADIQLYASPNAAQLLGAKAQVQAYKKNQREAARRNRLYYDRATGQTATVDPAYLQQERVMKSQARYLPGSITKPELINDLNAYQGAAVGAQQLANAGMDPTLVGYSWTTLPPQVRTQKLAEFAQLIAQLNVKPKYDAKLTTPESAAQVYPAADYIIQRADFDQNVFTPGSVIIMTSHQTTDRHGNVTPAGTIIAVDGWKLEPIKQSGHLRRLKEQMFYGQHPTKASRATISRKLWDRINFGDPQELKPAKQSLSWFARCIRTELENAGQWIPKTGTRAGVNQVANGPIPAVKEIPAVFELRTQAGNGPVEGGYFRASGPVFNTILYRTAELLFNMVIAPEIYARTTGIQPQNLSNAILAFRNAYDQTVVGQVPAYDQFGQINAVNQPVAGNEGYGAMNGLACPFNNFNPQNMYMSWNASYYHPKALAAFFQDDYFKQIFETIVNEFIQDIQQGGNWAGPYVGVALHQIVMWTMNSTLPTFMDDVIGRAAINAGDTAVYYGNIPTLGLLTPGEIHGLADEVDKLPVITTKDWNKEVRAAEDISLRGQSYVQQFGSYNETLDFYTNNMGTMADYVNNHPVVGQQPAAMMATHRNWANQAAAAQLAAQAAAAAQPPLALPPPAPPALPGGMQAQAQQVALNNPPPPAMVVLPPPGAAQAP